MRKHNGIPLLLSSKISTVPMQVLPHLVYCSIVLHKYTRALQQRVEQLPNYGMGLILSKSYRTPSQEMRRSLQWTTLAERRRKFRLTMVHCCLNRLCPKAMQSLFVKNNDTGYGSTEGAETIHIFPNQTELGRRSFSAREAMDWNLLPYDIRLIQSNQTFKRYLKHI